MLNSVKINDQAWEVQANGKCIGRVLKTGDRQFNAWVGDNNQALGDFPSKYAAKRAVKNRFEHTGVKCTS